jgi:NADH dehydrogenase/NADH:ubiquinone oxidoreductase subunit G
MGALIRILFPLIGYLATATVITLLLGLGYLWHTDRLTDDKVFRLVALLEGVDLQQIVEAQRKSDDEVPSEEPSMEAVLGQQQLLSRNFEVKLLALQRGRQEYDHRLQQLKERTERYDRLARDYEASLKKQGELATQESLAKVVSDLEQVKPAVAKNLLMRWIEEDRMDKVITILGKMSENKKKKILQSFSTPDELDKLHEIHRLMIEANATKQKIDEAQNALKANEN